MIECGVCGTQFATKSKKDYHVRNTHKAITIIVNTKSIQVTINKEKKGFICYRKDGHCQKILKTADGFQQHIKTCLGQWITEVRMIYTLRKSNTLNSFVFAACN